SVAVALRNRYRRTLLEDSIKEEIVPKNMLMIGATGIGKTEIACRLAKIIQAPLIKIEATKHTEAGYVVRHVEPMIRHLVEIALRIVKEEKKKEVEGKGTEEANKRIVKLLVPEMKKEKSVKNPFEMLFPNVDEDEDDSDKQEQDEGIADKRKNISKLLEMGE